MIVAMMRVKNEARWIKQVVCALFPLCDRVYMLNDHSTDGTDEICRAIPDVLMWDSPFNTLNECRDKNWLLDKVIAARPDWVIGIDGDELLPTGGQEKIRKTIASNRGIAYSFRVEYLWDSPSTIRADGVYATLRRPSLWQMVNPNVRFRSINNDKGGFHCTNVPYEQAGRAQHCDVKLLHFGYMHAEDRMRKFRWYTSIDPNNPREDGYLHMIQGDPGGPAASAKLKHAGPLRLERINAIP